MSATYPPSPRLPLSPFARYLTLSHCGAERILGFLGALGTTQLYFTSRNARRLWRMGMGRMGVNSPSFCRIEWLAHPVLFRRFLKLQQRSETVSAAGSSPRLVLVPATETSIARAVEEGTLCGCFPSFAANLLPVTCICDQVSELLWHDRALLNRIFPSCSFDERSTIPTSDQLLETLVGIHASPRTMLRLFASSPAHMTNLGRVINDNMERANSSPHQDAFELSASPTLTPKMWLEKLREGKRELGAEHGQRSCEPTEQVDAERILSQIMLILSVCAGSIEDITELINEPESQMVNSRTVPYLAYNMLNHRFLETYIPNAAVYDTLCSLLGCNMMTSLVARCDLSPDALERHLELTTLSELVDAQLLDLAHKLAESNDAQLIRRFLPRVLASTFAVNPDKLHMHDTTDLDAARALLDAVWDWQPEPIAYLPAPGQARYAIMREEPDATRLQAIPRGTLPDSFVFPVDVVRALVEEGMLNPLPDWRMATMAVGREDDSDERMAAMMGNSDRDNQIRFAYFTLHRELWPLNSKAVRSIVTRTTDAALQLHYGIKLLVRPFDS